MLAVSHRSSSALPLAHYGVMDESGTIDPAALNTPCKYFTGAVVRRVQPDSAPSHLAEALKRQFNARADRWISM